MGQGSGRAEFVDLGVVSMLGRTISERIKDRSKISGEVQIVAVVSESQQVGWEYQQSTVLLRVRPKGNVVVRLHDAACYRLSFS